MPIKDFHNPWYAKEHKKVKSQYHLFDAYALHPNAYIQVHYMQKQTQLILTNKNQHLHGEKRHLNNFSYFNS